MKPARVATVALVGAATALVGWQLLLLWVDRGGALPPLPWPALAGSVALAVAVVVVGLPVRRWQQARAQSRTARLDPLVAARTVVLAKAAAYGGALLAGWYAAQGLALLPDLVGSRRTRLLLAGACALGGVAVSVAGFVVQRWCRVPPDDQDEDGPSSESDVTQIT